MAQREEPCKGCRESVQVTDKAIEEMIKDLDASQTPQVEVEELNYRMAQCKSCSYFSYGTTCGLCGCIVPVKARILQATCPHPKASRWIRSV